MAARKRRGRRSSGSTVNPSRAQPKPASDEPAAEVPQLPPDPPDEDRLAEEVAERDHPIG